MKKRIFALVCGLAVAITCVLLVGCGGSDSGGNKDLSGSKYVGTWSGQKASFQDTEVTVEEVLHGLLPSNYILALSSIYLSAFINF